MDVVYEGIRLTPARIARTAVEEGVHVVGLSILSGSHRELIPAVLDELRAAGADVPVVVGGIIPPEDERALRDLGVARVYTPKDFRITAIVGDIVDLVAERAAAAPAT
jgi:(2R)-ethylmalonyl-CoA mutase